MPASAYALLRLHACLRRRCLCRMRWRCRCLRCLHRRCCLRCLHRRCYLRCGPPPRAHATGGALEKKLCSVIIQQIEFTFQHFILPISTFYQYNFQHYDMLNRFNKNIELIISNY
jgi:hypothetical protein